MRLVISSCLNSGVPVKPMKAAFGKREAHVARKPPRLRAVRLVGNHDDVVALAVGVLRIDVLVELVDQAEDVGVVFLQEPFEVVSRRGARRVLAGDAAAGEGLVNLVVEVVAIGHQQEGEIARHLPAHLLGEERHGIGLAAALRVPEHAEPAEIGMRPLDDVHRAFGDEGRQAPATVRFRLRAASRFSSAIARLSSGSSMTRCCKPLLRRELALQRLPAARPMPPRG